MATFAGFESVPFTGEKLEFVPVRMNVGSQVDADLCCGLWLDRSQVAYLANLMGVEDFTPVDCRPFFTIHGLLYPLFSLLREWGY